MTFLGQKTSAASTAIGQSPPSMMIKSRLSRLSFTSKTTTTTTSDVTAAAAAAAVTTTKRRSSSFLFRKSLPPTLSPATPDMLRILNAIAISPSELINELLETRGDLITKIRFITCVDQFLAAHDKDKRDKMGRTLCEVFLTSSSGGGKKEMFKITTLSPLVEAQLLHRRLSFLEVAKWEVVQELSQNNDVLLAVNNVERLFAVI